MDDAYDAVVVGGGIVGASSAYHLARNGLETLLLDRGDEGRATDAGAGILSPATSSRAGSADWFEFATDAVAYYETLVERLEREGVDRTGYDRTDLLTVAVTEDEVDEYEAALGRIENRQERLGEPAPGSIEELPATAARERFPPLSAVERAFHYTDAARVDGRTFADALLEAGRERGLAVETGDVTGIEFEDGRIAGVRTASGRVVAADRAIVAGGAWSGPFADDLGVEIPVEPQRGQIAHLELSDAETDEWPLVTGFRGHYVVPWPDGRIAVGATRENDAGFDVRKTAGGVREVLAEALRTAPGLGEATLLEVRVGVRPTTPDGLPILGAVPDVDGAYLATGHGPTGLQLGPYSGKVIADLAAGESVRGLRPFSVGRFDGGW